MILAINTMYSILLTFVTYAIGFFYHIRDENRAFSHNFYSETERKTSLKNGLKLTWYKFEMATAIF